MALSDFSDDNDNDRRHLTTLDIGNESEEGDASSSLMLSSSSDSDRVGPLDDGKGRRAAPNSPSSPRQRRDDDGMLSARSPHARAPTPPTKTTNLPLLTACYLSALTTGATTYAFSFYSAALKSSLRLSQNQLDTLGAATFCAGVLSWMPGMVVDARGARFATALGGTSNAVMLGLYWMLATQRWKLRDLDLLILVLSALGVLIFVVSPSWSTMCRFCQQQ